MSGIKRARLLARLTQHEIGSAIGRTGQYVGMVERGDVPVSADLEHVILVAIARLKTTERYLHSSDKLKQAAVEKLSEFGRRLPSAPESTVAENAVNDRIN